MSKVPIPLSIGSDSRCSIKCIPKTIKWKYMSAYQVADSGYLLERNNWIKYDFWMVSILDFKEMAAWKPGENMSQATGESGKEIMLLKWISQSLELNYEKTIFWDNFIKIEQELPGFMFKTY